MTPRPYAPATWLAGVPKRRLVLNPQRRRFTPWTDEQVTCLQAWLDQGWKPGAPPFERMTLTHVRTWLGHAVPALSRAAAVTDAMDRCGWRATGTDSYRRVRPPTTTRN